MEQIWQDKTSRHSFRIQTENKTLHQKMRSDRRFHLIGTGHNIEVWIYHARFPSLKKAFTEIEALKDMS